MAGPNVIDVNEATFVQEVVERSREVPVLLDVWAAWCGPCRVLGPVLEKVVDEFGGGVLLAKIDADAAPNITSALGITSLPTVALFVDGQPVDGFVGAQPESVVRAFLERHVAPAAPATDDPDAHEVRPRSALAERASSSAPPPPPGTSSAGSPAAQGVLAAGAPPVAPSGAPAPPDPVAEADARLRSGDVVGARAAADRLLAEKRVRPGARLLAARAALAAGDEAALRTHLQAIEPETSDSKRRAQLEEAWSLRALGAQDAAGFRQRLAADVGDLEARYRVGLAEFAQRRPREALEALLDVVVRDRRWNDQAARKAMVALFAALGDAHPLVDEFRKRLMIVL